MTKFVQTALEAVETMCSGEFAWCHSMAATPTVLLEALAQHAASLQDITLMQLHLEHAEVLASPELEGRLRNRCFFAGKVTRALINQGRADYVPMFLSEIPKLFRRGELTEGTLMDHYVTFMAGIFRSVRFGASSAHGKANMVRFHFFEQQDAFHRDDASGKYSVDFDKMQAVSSINCKELRSGRKHRRPLPTESLSRLDSRLEWQ